MISSPFEVHVNDQYRYYNIDHSIRAQSHKKVAKKFLISKYKRNTSTFNNKVWSYHSQIINHIPRINKRFNLRFIHDRLSIGLMQFTYDHRCSYCQLPFDATAPHDHFNDSRPENFYTKIEKKSNITSVNITTTETTETQNIRHLLTRNYLIETASENKSQ